MKKKNNKRNDIYDKFKERFEKKAKSNKDKKILNQEKIKSKTLDHQKNLKNNNKRLNYHIQWCYSTNAVIQSPPFSKTQVHFHSLTQKI